MKVRIFRVNNFYYGQVCVAETKNATHWRIVTNGCFTKKGAQKELEKWKQKEENKSNNKEFEI